MALPIRPIPPSFHSAADGPLGGIMKLYREWRISGDTTWMRALWPQVRRSLEYCIETWDPERRGVLVEPRHNTYDIEIWGGANGMSTSFDLGALQAATLMGEALGENVSGYADLLQAGRERMETLFNGEFFTQDVRWKDLKAPSPMAFQGIQSAYSPEALALLEEEGPKYQYGSGCLSDGVLGSWLAEVCGMEAPLDRERMRRHLSSVYRYNFRRELAEHANPQRAHYANGAEGGLLLCSWPRGGARYDAVERELYLRPALTGDFQCFLSVETGYGLVRVKGGEPFVDVREGEIVVRELRYQPRLS